ncbi:MULTISPECIES: nucleotide exchange factor GrpE [Gardnerella]|uniref:Protein GrpE n=1 Tax=Gardnerella greenwoodii 00703Dmash TaxID=698960 RepID=I4M9I9_9BIFI|nr:MULTISPECIES: nucleotide exchange factor GrpE [Gardnerella]EIK85879.1 heat shock protein GrpE [Gardnerella greenwoodii 00703Dmash]EIK87217.1 heat shock protein GrpE [Gardnerella vaginalis 6119V5]
MSDFNTNEYLQGMEDSDSLDVKPAEDSAKTSAQSSKQAENVNRAETEADEHSDANVSADSADSVDSANVANSSESSESSESKDSKDADDSSLTPLGKAKKEAAEYLEALQRERAEFINFRNRSAKEQDRFRQHGIIDVLTALLPALDDIDRIREHSEMDDSFKAVATKIDKAFEKFGVEKFGEKGEDFDPTKHDAVLHRPDPDATKETVDAVVEAGYRIGDRVIRAARVVVSSPSNS